MEAILTKLCEKSEQELWDLLKEPEWTKDHAEVAFYMVEIMKGVKKIEHLKKLDEAMEQYDWQEEMMEGKEKSQFARSGNSGGNRGGRTSGGRGSGGRSGGMANYAMFDYDEGEGEGMENYARGGRGRGRTNYNYDYNYMPYPEWEEEKRHYPPMYYGDKEKDKEREKDKIVAEHFENKYKELLEDKWEKEKEKKETGGSTRMPPPPPGAPK